MLLLALTLALLAPPPVTKVHDQQFGNVLATRGGLALYFWDTEKDFRIHCTAGCAKAWPPLLVRPGAKVATRVAGISGTFGTVRRPEGTTQVTFNRRPVYTYVGDAPGRILCDNEGGWHVVRLR